MRRLFRLTPALCTLILGCATPQADPLEPLNRSVSDLNRSLASTLDFLPGDRFAEAEPVTQSIANVASNLREPLYFTNALLQGRECAAGIALRRFLVNSTLGLGGLFDIAKSAGGLQSYSTDFGQTLGVWGVDAGPYVVLPLMGPTNVRGIAGSAVEFVADPVNLPLLKAGAAAGWAVTGVELASDVLQVRNPGGVGAGNNGDFYLEDKREFERTEALAMSSNNDCPLALQGPFWAQNSD